MTQYSAPMCQFMLAGRFLSMIEGDQQSSSGGTVAGAMRKISGSLSSVSPNLVLIRFWMPKASRRSGSWLTPSTITVVSKVIKPLVELSSVWVMYLAETPTEIFSAI